MTAVTRMTRPRSAASLWTRRIHHLVILQIMRHLQLRHLRPERHGYRVYGGEALRSMHADHCRGSDGGRRRDHCRSCYRRRRHGLNCSKVTGKMPRVLHLMFERDVAVAGGCC